MKHLLDCRFRKTVSAALLALAFTWSGAGAAAAHSHGRKRSREARDAFKRSHPCPSTGKSHGTCPGYTIDHIKPLKRCGSDAPGNMEWQTKAEAKAKDKWE